MRYSGCDEVELPNGVLHVPRSAVGARRLDIPRTTFDASALDEVVVCGVRFVRAEPRDFDVVDCAD